MAGDDGLPDGRATVKMKKLSVSLSGHQTSISLEPEFISALQRISQADNRPIASIISHIDESRAPDTNLSSAVRIWILHRVTNNKF